MPFQLPHLLIDESKDLGDNLIEYALDEVTKASYSIVSLPRQVGPSKKETGGAGAHFRMFTPTSTLVTRWTQVGGSRTRHCLFSGSLPSN